MKNSNHRLVVGLTLVLAVAALPVSSARGATGDIKWQHQVDIAGGMDEVAGMSLRGQKVLVVGGVGPSVPGGTIDTWFIRAYNAAKGGIVAWEQTFVNPNGEVTMGGLSASGNRVYVTGSQETSGGNHQLILKVYDARKGDMFWDDEADFGDDDSRGHATYLKGRNGWVVGARTDSVSGKTKWVVREYDAKTGGLRWEDIPAGETDDPRGATHLFLQGSMLIVGGVAEDGGGTTDWRLRGYSTKTDSMVWQDTYDSGFGDDVLSGLKGMGKRFVIGGTIAKAGGSQMRITTVETKTGAFIWEDVVDEGAVNVAVDVVGHGPCVFMGGEVDGDFFIRGYATFTGANMWTDRVDSGGFDAANAMATFGSKTVFAAGERDDGGGSGDRFIRNYSFHTGEIVWEEIQDVDGDDGITGIVAKGKNVFTVGHADRPDDDQDWIVTNHQR